MKRKLVAVLVIAAAAAAWPQGAEACTGITLKAKDGAYVVARTIEWGGSNLNSRYVVVPRGYSQHSYTPQGTDGMEFIARYGYVGMAVEQEEFVAEGLNEAGLSAGLFYFPGYGVMRRSMPRRNPPASPICSSCRGYWAVVRP